MSQLKDASAHIFVASKSVEADYGRQHEKQVESLQDNSKVTVLRNMKQQIKNKNTEYGN